MQLYYTVRSITLYNNTIYYTLYISTAQYKLYYTLYNLNYIIDIIQYSLDEAALVSGVQKLGWQFTERTPDTVTIKQVCVTRFVW